MLIYLIIGLLAGFASGFFLAKSQKSKPSSDAQDNQQEQNELLEFKTKAAANEQLVKHLKEQQTTLQAEKSEIEEQAKHFEIELEKANKDLEHLRKGIDEKEREVKDLQATFKNEFKALANEILKEQSKDFSEQNKGLLAPFREQIGTFQEVIQKQIKENIERATSFKEQLQQLKDMNLQISSDAKNLADALKGDNKQQGNWGELVLERILERSELIKGEEYETQVSDTNNEGKRIQPDVVVYLPEDKHIIIDSKVSLVAYEKYCSSSDEQEQQKALNEHLLSVKSHIKNLSEKKYESASKLNSPDFILLFIPVESSFGLAVKTDIELFNYAWDRKIVLVSPSTLLATLKTVSSIWKQEKQNKNVQLIAEESGKLYDKFVGFIEDLDSLENSFNKVSAQFDDAKKKLSTGKGNIIGKIEKLKTLGAKAKKDLPPHHLDN